MDFCTAHFSKDIKNVTFEDVIIFFKERRTENDILEFKSIQPAEALEKQIENIRKVVCAFLNSGGGLLIWGSPLKSRDEITKKEYYQGEITAFPQPFEKDSLVSKIFDSLIPLPNGIRIEIKENDGNSIVLIEVDEGSYAPHQYQNAYLMRIDGQNKPAPHHYIEALFKRIRYPNLECYLKIIKIVPGLDYIDVQIAVAFFNLSPVLNEEDLHFRMIVGPGKFKNYMRNPELHALDGHEYYKEIARRNFHFGEPVIEDAILSFRKDDLRSTLKKNQLIINFGGRFSPVKTSVYTLLHGPHLSADLDKLIISKIENKLIKDLQNEKGLDEKSMIRDTMEQLNNTRPII